MEFWQQLWTLILVILFSCKTTTPNRQPAPTPQQSTVDEMPLDLSRQQESPLSGAEVCKTLAESDEFPSEQVSWQMKWLCGSGGFELMRTSSWAGTGDINVREYFAEHDRSVYYGSGLIMKGNFTQSDLGGVMFCHDPEGLRKRVNDRGFEGVKALSVTRADENSCEYVLRLAGDWGVSQDMKVERTFGELRSLGVRWRVENLVVPLNYSAVSQHSALFLSWQEQDGVHGVYLLRAQSRVGGIHMNSARSRWKTAVAGTIQATAAMISGK